MPDLVDRVLDILRDFSWVGSLGFALIGALGIVLDRRNIARRHERAVSGEAAARPEPPWRRLPTRWPSSQDSGGYGTLAAGDDLAAEAADYAEEDYVDVTRVGGQPPLSGTGRELDAALAKMDRSNFAFKAPRRMRVGDVKAVRGVLQPGATVETLRGLLRDADGHVEVARDIRVSKVMQASLTGHGFSIQAVGSAEQAVSDTEPTEWRWDVKATEPGTHVLTLTLFVVVVIDGKDRLRRIQPSFEQTIQVDVAPRSFVERVGAVIEPYYKVIAAIAFIVATAWGLYEFLGRFFASPEGPVT